MHLRKMIRGRRKKTNDSDHEDKAEDKPTSNFMPPHSKWFDCPEGDQSALQTFLMPDLFGIISSNLGLKDLTRLSLCNKQLKATLPSADAMVTLKPKYFWYDDNLANDVVQIEGAEMVLKRRIHVIVIAFRWRDQGWGNQKGAIFVRLIRKGKQFLEMRLPHTAPHENEQREVYLQAPQSVIRRACGGDTLQLCRHVGGGGGHSLSVEHLQCIVGYVTEQEDKKLEVQLQGEEERMNTFTEFMCNPKFKFKASTEWDHENGTHPAKSSIYNKHFPGKAGAWCAGVNDQNQWIEVDMHKPYLLTSMIVQGRADLDQAVTSYRLGLSNNGQDFVFLNGGQVFQHNPRADMGTVHNFTESFVCGRYIRCYPITWHGHVSMRWGFTGRKANKEEIEQSERLIEEGKKVQ